MAKQNFMKVILTLLLLLTIGCSLIGDVTFTATIDGEEFKAVVGLWDDSLSQIPFAQIIATDGDMNTFTIFIPGAFEVKTYTLGSFEQATEGYAVYISQGMTYTSQSGSTLTITSKTERLEGTFEMTLVGMTESGEEVTLEVTDGVFDLPGSPLM